MDRKIKVVLLCHYWSDDMAEMVGRKHYFRELSPWIQETINLFKGKNDVEFHVVAPNYASNTDLLKIERNINYHYYHYAPFLFSNLVEPVINKIYNHAEPYKLAERLGNCLSSYNVASRNAIKIVRDINPDIIHLYGSENPDYSKAALKLMDEYTTLMTLQGYAYRMGKSNGVFEIIFHWYMRRYEDKINKKVRFRTISRPMTKDEVVIPEKHFFEKCERLFLVTSITKVPNVDAYLTEKKYDVVFYARIVKDKGIEDLIEALYRLKQNGRIVTAVVMGRGNETYIDKLKESIIEKNIEEQINFVGFVEKHEDVYNIAAQARLLVLPTYQDGINNTVREAMFMRLPIVANYINLLNRANDRRHCVHFVEKSNIDSLIRGLCKVLDDDEYRECLINNAYQEAMEVYSPDAVYKQTLLAYKEVMMFNNKTK